MRPQEITREVVLKELHEIAVAKRDECGVPDFRYHMYEFTGGVTQEACWYVHPEKDVPACIVGYWLHRHGVPLDVLRANEDQIASAVLMDVMRGLPYEVVDLLDSVQDGQDCGMGWLEAIDMARLQVSLEEMEEKGDGSA